MKNIALIAIAVILLGAFSTFGQTNNVPLEEILTQAQRQTESYREAFKNLLADETKTFEEFDKNGASEKKTVVKSNFLVYQSGRNAKATAELRNVLEVNGKPVSDSQKRGEQFLAELEKTTTFERELKKLQSEGSRFDKTWEVYGLTLNEAVALAPNLRPAFNFALMGTENYQGRPVYVVSYQQTKKSPYITVNEKNKTTDALSLDFNLDIPGALKKTDLFLRGKLWIDAQNFQIWREERHLTAGSGEGVLLQSNVFEYQTSEYGILVPKNISLNIFNAKKEKDGEKYSAVKDTTINFEYSKFRQTNVEVKILDDETQ